MISRKRLYIANKKALKRIRHLIEEVPSDPGRYFIGEVNVPYDVWLYHMMVSHRKTTKHCSRYCCGNPRKFFGELPHQWIKANAKFKQELKEER